MEDFDPRVTPWQVSEKQFPWDGDASVRARFLLRYALLAPSSHNSQPWRFVVDGGTVRFHADESRWLRVADPEQRELYESVGCALESFLVAAEHFGYGTHVAYAPDGARDGRAATVELVPLAEPASFRAPELFDTITARHTNHKSFDGRPVPDQALRRLEGCCVEPGLWLHLTSDAEMRRKVDDLVVRADALLLADPAYREELARWIAAGVFGTPWLMSKLAALAVAHVNLGKRFARKDHELLQSSPVLGVLVSDGDDRATWVRVGQVFERVYLTATGLGLALQPMSQLVEAHDVRAELRRLLPAKGYLVQQPFRLGFAAPEPVHTPRRPLAEVLVDASPLD